MDFDWLPDWLKPRQKQEETVPEGVGAITGCPLDELSSLVLPFSRDPFYRLRPGFTHQGAALSLELARLAYTLEVEPWLQAGWDDISIQIDNSLYTGLGSGGEGAVLQQLKTNSRLQRAKAAMQDNGAVSLLMDALMQKERGETTKAVVMLHPLPDGKYLVAIGFMGTGKRLQDWISNLRIATEEGFHKGFYRLCTCFEENMEGMRFPATAHRLGLEDLTLRHILEEMRCAGSRFRLWMAGHSQGSAVMQVFAHQLIHHMGVLPQNICGYGFASPTVATGRLVYDPASYPLIHILNSDDLVPRIGAVVHLGLCLEYTSNQEMRAHSYHAEVSPEKTDAYVSLIPFRKKMTDGPSVLARGWALLTALKQELDKPEEDKQDRNLLAALWEQAVNYAGKTAAGWLDSYIDYLEKSYQEITGHTISPEEQQRLLAEVAALREKHSLRTILETLGETFSPPHSIVRRGKDGAYAYIVKHGSDMLIPFIWVKPKGSLPVRRYAAQPMQPAGEGESHTVHAVRRKSIHHSGHCVRGVRRMGLSERRKK